MNWGVLLMMYAYGTNDSYTLGRKSASVEELAEIIIEDVEMGKWNKYEGGKSDSITAHCRYSKKGFVFHNHLLIFGNKDEFKELEDLISGFIEVVPREFQ